MKTIDYSLDSEKNGGHITAFSYSHSLSDLVGSWSASAAGGNFKAGNSISFTDVMKNGIIAHAYKDSDGLWHLEGKDAGVKLMKSTPDISELPQGSAKKVIEYIADFCGLSLSMNSNGLSDFSVRSIISGSTCAEAVLELALVSGLIAYINHNGVLVVEKASSSTPTFKDVIDDSASDIDLDGYATQVLVTMNYRKKIKDETSDKEIIIGSTPSSKPDRETVSGLFRNGHYSLTKLEPFGVIEESSVSFTEGDLTIKTEEKHTYDYKHKTIWRDNQEYLLFAFIETGYSLTRTVEGLGFEEVTTETMKRTISGQDAMTDIPDDWKGDINFIEAETITRSTVRKGNKTPDDNMPPYAPEFDSKITREFSQKNKGKDLLCRELEETYEARQVGKIARVFNVDDSGKKTPVTLPDTDDYLAIQAHSIPEWVLVKTYSTFYERHDPDGNCLLSTQSQYSDDGAEWLQAHALYDTGDEDMDDYEKDYAQFSQRSSGLNVSFNSSGRFANWTFIELPGRMKVTRDDVKGIVLAEVDSWYDNGQYVHSSVCPHYNSSTKSCNIYKLDETDDTGCLRYKGLNWGYCSRAITAIKYAREQEVFQVEAPVIGSASLNGSSSKSPNVGYQRDIYIDDELENEAQAQKIADTIAKNILAIKGKKGIRKTVTIPYSTEYQPNGTIIEISYDWENLQTSITYKEEGDIPDFLISQNIASIAAFVSTRENARVNIPKYGVIYEIDENDETLVSVTIGSSNVSCSTKLKNLAQNDIVLVSFPAGNKLRGQVIARL